MQKPQSTTTIFIVSVGIILISLNILRILNVPITHDEARTYLTYVSSTFKNITICSPVTANNHIFNSLLTKCFVIIFKNNSPFILRLGNLLAQVVYIIYTYHLLKKIFDRQIWIICAFLVLNLNPYIFDYWGLCRGYGLSIAFMMAGIYHILCYLQQKTTVQLYIIVAFSILYVYSNMAFLNVYFGFVGVIIMYDILHLKSIEKKYIINQVAGILIGTVILYILLIQPVLDLLEMEQFYFGGQQGFLKDTVYTLVKENFFIDSDASWLITIAYAIAFITIVAGGYWVRQIKRNKENDKMQTGFLLWILMMVPVLSTILQHWVLGSKYLIERTAIFFIPLFLVQLLYFLQVVCSKHPKAGWLIMLVLTSGSLINFITRFNITYARDWRYDQNNLVVIEKIMAQREDKNSSLTIRPFWIFVPSMKYYAATYYNKLQVPVDLNDGEPPTADTSFDYYYVDQNEVWRLSPVYKPVDTFQNGNFILLHKTGRH